MLRPTHQLEPRVNSSLLRSVLSPSQFPLLIGCDASQFSSPTYSSLVQLLPEPIPHPNFILEDSASRTVAGISFFNNL
jgi:hypothetical protein